MTAAGQAQATAAQAIAPALASLSRSLARTRNATPASYAAIALNLHGCLSSLASTVNDTGYDAYGQWRGEFLPGQATDPEWLRATSYAAAGHIANGAALTLPVRAARVPGADRSLPAVRAGAAASQACRGLRELVIEHHRAQAWPQVPEYAAILGALHAACGPLATSLTVIAPRLAGIEPDWSSVWCEDFAGDLPAAYGDAGRYCQAGGRALYPVSDRTAADVRTWRSRSRPRPGTVERRGPS
jgi:hypothetical protein